MNGAMALDCENTISRPNRTNMTTIGTSQYFFSWRRNAQKSDTTRPLLIPPSIHALIVPAIAVAVRVRRPSRRGAAAACERILSRQAPEEPDGYEDQHEHHRQQHARVEIPDDAGHAPPPDVGPFEQRRPDRAEHDQRGAGGGHDLRRQQPAAPEQRRREDAEDGA